MSLVLRTFVRALHLLFPGEPDTVPPQREDLPAKIARWRRQAEEFESLGCTELARSYRESIRACERQLSLSTLRKAA